MFTGEFFCRESFEAKSFDETGVVLYNFKKAVKVISFGRI